MNHITHYGIVIRTETPAKKVCIILDSKLGLIETIFFNEQIMQRAHHGMLLEYNALQQKKKYKIDNIKLLALPQPWATEDIVFFHQVIHIISEYMMLGMVNQQLFTLVTMLYRHHVAAEDNSSNFNKLFKSWFLCRLYCLLGIYPENYHSFDSSFFILISNNESIFNLPKEAHIELQVKLQRWLEACKRTCL